MITAIKADSKNIEAYKALYDEASDILRGYKRVRTYNNEETYYRRNDDAKTPEELYVKLDITSLSEFAAALAARGFLYIKHVDEKGEWLYHEDFDPMHKITTLEEYFSWLKSITELSPANKKYTVLPLDEPHFTIDTDSRAISIPAAFKKNGIAVQGDDLAETVYFKVDRYYDYMDLNNCDIYIQWEAPKNPKDPKGDVIKGLSAAELRDIESEPGKLIFDWTISKAITQNPGTLKFSVRFFQWENKENAENDGEKILGYSLSTLTASVSIQTGMNFDLEVDPPALDDAGKRIVSRLKNSIIAGGYAAAMPIFEKNLDDTVSYDLDKNKDNTYDLLVQAYATDTGSISYTWRRQELLSDNTTIDANGDSTNIEPLSGVNVYVEVTDYSNLNSAYAYYWITGSDSDGNAIYTRYPKFELDDDGTIIGPNEEDAKKEDFALFVKQSKLTVTKSGIYHAIAENRITNSTTPAESKHVKFLWPTPVDIKTQPAPSVILTELEDGTFKGEVFVEVNNTDGDVLYAWEKDDNYSIVFDENDANFKPISGEELSHIDINEPGRYRVFITNKRNLEELHQMSAICRVTKAPEEPEYEIKGSNQFSLNNLTSSNGPTIQLDSSIESDYYEVQWYLVENDIHYPVFKQDVAHGVYEVTLDLTNEDLFNTIQNIPSDDPNFNRDLDGVYYPIVTNIVNDQRKSTGIPTDSAHDMFWVL